MSVSNIISNSSTAALIELSALGAQDTLLTCDPTKSLFHQTYSRVTNFALGEHTMLMDSAPSGTNWGESVVTAEMDRTAGDLLGPVYLDFSLSGLPQHVYGLNEFMLWTPAVGFAIIDESQVKIGNQVYEKLSGEYLMMHDEISRPEGRRASKLVGDYAPYLRNFAPFFPSTVTIPEEAGGFPIAQQTLGAFPPMVNSLAAFASSDTAGIIKGIEYSTRTQAILAPLNHFWTRNPGDYLNMVGAQYQQVKLQLKLRKYTDLAMKFTYVESGEMTAVADVSVAEPSGVISGMQILAVSVYLDQAERRLKAQTAQTSRFVYVQRETHDTNVDQKAHTINFDNHFKNPVSRLLWAWRADAAKSRKEYFQFGAYRGTRVRVSNAQGGGFSESSTAQEVTTESTAFEWLINNQSRIAQKSEYFLYAQPYERATRVPTRIVYSYALALEPDCDHEYTGSLNFSRLDNIVFRSTLKDVVTDLDPPLTETLYLDYSNRMGGLNSVSCSLFSSDAARVTEGSAKGKYLLFAETNNFYKQAAGMFGLLFPV